MARRAQITDRARQEVEPLLPENRRSAGQRREHRAVVNGILWNELRTASPRRDLPETYGAPGRPASTTASTAAGATAPGIACRPARPGQERDAVGEVEWEVGVDDAVVRGAHRHAAGARSRPPSAADEKKGRWVQPVSATVLASVAAGVL